MKNTTNPTKRIFNKSLFIGLFSYIAFAVNASAQSYCDPSHYGATYNNYISNVSIGGIDKTTAGGDGQKNDYTGDTDGAMSQGTSYSISFSANKVAWLSYLSVYIDWNDDGDWDDASETVLDHDGIPTGAGTYTYTNATYTCPTIATGTVRMRVVNSIYNNYSACSDWDYGEFEDYEIVVSAATPNVKDNNTTDLDQAGSWTTSVPTSGEVALWESTVTGANSTALGSDIEFQGVEVQDPGGLVTISAGNTLTIGTAGIEMGAATQSMTVASAVALGANQDWDVNTSRTLTASGVVNGAYKISKLGAGTLTLSGTNTFTGGVDHDAGTLNINSAAALGTTAGTLTLADEVVIDNTSGGSITTSNYPISITDDFTFTGTNDLNLGTGAVTLNAASTITTSTAAKTLELGGIIGGSYGVVKAGAGTLELSGANTFTGGVTLNTGTLNIANADALGTTAGTFTIANGTTIDNTSGGILTTSNYPIVINGDFTFTGTNSMTLGSGTVSLGADLTITTTSGSLSFDGIVSGAYNVTKDGLGHVYFNNTANTYTGKTTISQTSSSDGAVFFKTIGNVSGGASSLGAPTTVGNGTIAIGNGVYGGKLMSLATSDQSTDRVIDLASTTGEIQLDAGDGANISYTSDFTATGAGSKTLALRGTTTSNIISGVIPDNSGANLTSLDKRESGTWILTGTNTFTGTTTITDGTLQLGNAGTTGEVASTSIVNAGTLKVNRSNSYTYSGVISGAGIVEQAGSGTLVFTGTNTYTGNTKITAGTLQLGAADVISNSSTVDFNGGTLSTGSGAGYSETVGSMVLTANSTLDLATGDHTLAFAGSAGETWGAAQLTIENWNGGYNSTAAGASDPKITVGADASGLTAGQLAKIGFTNPSNALVYGAALLGTGELVPKITLLPVTLLSYSGHKMEDYSLIQWTTGSEIQSDYFELLWSENGTDFFPITTMSAAQISSSEIDYYFRDYENTEGVNYYKLIQYDLDGTRHDLGMVLLNYNNLTANQSMYPNPLTRGTKIVLNTNADDLFNFNIYNESGLSVYESELVVYKGDNVLNLNTALFTPGIYIFSFKNSGSVISHRIAIK